MNIYIKGMDMPKDCGECFVGNRTICSKHCPLAEVKEPHGRLVDADMAYQETMVYGEHFRKSVLKVISNLPTVIESEVEG